MYTVLAGPRRPLFRLGTFWPCPLFASSFPRLLPLRASSSKLPTLRMADGGVCAQPRPFHIMNRRTNGQMRQMSGRPSLSHVGRIIICPYAFGATKSATARATVFKSVFVPFHRVKMHVPKSRRTTKGPTADFISRAPLSILTLRSARNERIRHITIFV